MPFCQSDEGCPIHNLIPEWNDLVYRGQWREALDRLHKTNNFPEFTGRVCPGALRRRLRARYHRSRSDHQEHRDGHRRPGLSEGWISPARRTRTGKAVAIVGSGPAGLAAADQLNKAGHAVPCTSAPIGSADC